MSGAGNAMNKSYAHLRCVRSGGTCKPIFLVLTKENAEIWENSSKCYSIHNRNDNNDNNRNSVQANSFTR